MTAPLLRLDGLRAGYGHVEVLHGVGLSVPMWYQPEAVPRRRRDPTPGGGSGWVGDRRRGCSDPPVARPCPTTGGPSLPPVLPLPPETGAPVLRGTVQV